MMHLTTRQMSHIRELVRHSKSVEIVGYDIRNFPVVLRTDANGTRQYAIAKDGRGIDTMGHILQLTVEESYELPGQTFAFLARVGLLPEEGEVADG